MKLNCSNSDINKDPIADNKYSDYDPWHAYKSKTVHDYLNEV